MLLVPQVQCLSFRCKRSRVTAELRDCYMSEFDGFEGKEISVLFELGQFDISSIQYSLTQLSGWRGLQSWFGLRLHYLKHLVGLFLHWLKIL